MKIITGKTGRPHVTSRQFRGMMEGIIGQDSYVITHGENLEPELMTNNKLKIKSGMMCHHGNISTVEIGTYDEVTIQNGTQGMKRIDLIVNRYSKEEGSEIEENNWVVIQGIPSAETPVAPAYTEGNLQEGDLVDDCPVFEAYKTGKYITYQDALYKVLQNHTSQADWAPDTASSLYAKVLTDPTGKVLPWEQPNSTNPYKKGDRVTHKGKTWESLVDSNVWEPGAVGSESLWKEVA